MTEFIIAERGAGKSTYILSAMKVQPDLYALYSTAAQADAWRKAGEQQGIDPSRFLIVGDLHMQFLPPHARIAVDQVEHVLAAFTRRSIAIITGTDARHSAQDDETPEGVTE